MIENPVGIMAARPNPAKSLKKSREEKLFDAAHNRVKIPFLPGVNLTLGLPPSFHGEAFARERMKQAHLSKSHGSSFGD
ncbi:MAG: hypothetical protein KIH10_01340 [Candidatus Freyarchaeota archaeon]|nr:hypothetical protein [Candidatus Jordarchaeia archaeon]MBS7279366.1 hypothetical protein [Candidatus Jordarchaeia archaeon]